MMGQIDRDELAGWLEETTPDCDHRKAIIAILDHPIPDPPKVVEYRCPVGRAGAVHKQMLEIAKINPDKITIVEYAKPDLPELPMGKLQDEIAKWNKHNFPDATDQNMFVGVVEEVGELAHSMLKKKQGIRLNEDHEAKARDAVGDICIYLMALCHKRNWSFYDCILKAWDEVKERDWTKECTLNAADAQKGSTDDKA